MRDLREEVDVARSALCKFEAEKPTNLKMKAPYDRALSVLRARLEELMIVTQENIVAKDRLATLKSIEEVKNRDDLWRRIMHVPRPIPSVASYLHRSSPRQWRFQSLPRTPEDWDSNWSADLKSITTLDLVLVHKEVICEVFSVLLSKVQNDLGARKEAAAKQLGLDMSCYQTFLHRVLTVNPGPLMLRSSYDLETLALCNDDSKPIQGTILERVKGYTSMEDFRRGSLAVEEYRARQACLEAERCHLLERFAELSRAQELKMLLPSDATSPHSHTTATAQRLVASMSEHLAEGLMRANQPEPNNATSHGDTISTSCKLPKAQINRGASGCLHLLAPRTSNSLRLFLLQQGLADVVPKRESNSAPSTSTAVTAADGGCAVMDAGVLFNTDLDMHLTCGLNDDYPAETDLMVLGSGDNAFLELLASDSRDHQADIPACAPPSIPQSEFGATSAVVEEVKMRGLEEGTAVRDCVAVAVHDGWTSDGFFSSQRAGDGGAFTKMDEVLGQLQANEEKRDLAYRQCINTMMRAISPEDTARIALLMYPACVGMHDVLGAILDDGRFSHPAQPPPLTLKSSPHT